MTARKHDGAGHFWLDNGCWCPPPSGERALLCDAVRLVVAETEVDGYRLAALMSHRWWHSLRYRGPLSAETQAAARQAELRARERLIRYFSTGNLVARGPDGDIERDRLDEVRTDVDDFWWLERPHGWSVPVRALRRIISNSEPTPTILASTRQATPDAIELDEARLPEPPDSGSHSKGGRPDRFDWPSFDIALFLLLDEEGVPDPRISSKWTKAKVCAAMQTWIKSERWDVEPADSTMRKKVSEGITAFKMTRAQN